MQPNETQAPTLHPSPLTSAAMHQCDLALDHPRLSGLSPSERQDAIVIIAQLMLEASGLSHAAMKENSDEQA